MNRSESTLLLVASLAACLVATSSVRACPCQGSAGPGAPVTTAYETWGASVMTSGRLVHGAWDSQGTYSPLREDSRQWMVDLALAFGYRPVRRLELGARAGFGHQSVTAPGTDSSRTSFGDTVLRLRWEAIDEPMPLPDAPLFSPAVAVIAGLRMPTGPVVRAGGGGAVSTASGTTGSIGSTASTQGLGAWEPSIAVDVQRTFARRVRLGLLGEAAYRFPDNALGVSRHLGPRALGEVNATYLPSTAWAFGVMTDLGWEGPVAYEGERRVGTAMRLWNVGAYAYHTFIDAGIRLGALLRVAPPVDAISVNAVGTTSLALSVTYAE